MENNTNIECLPKTSCTGCKMCADICPQKAILFAEDEETFVYPLVDSSRCTHCGLCVHACPALNTKLHNKVGEVYSAYATNSALHETGSSGGLFPLFADAILGDGNVVYGAAFDENLKLKHCRVTDIRDLRPLCKSKYVQSDCGTIYLKVKSDMQLGKKVLFVGTPCQCQALKNFIGEKWRENLILIDFVCHGVPSQHLFDDNIRWNSKRYGNIKSIEFRYKSKGGVKHPQTLKMVYEKEGEEKSLLRLHYQDPFYFGFQKHITLRPSCYQCKWARAERCSDITIGDFWGIEKMGNGLNSKKGVSCVLLNTEKGVSLFAKIGKHLSGVFSFPIEFAVDNNECLQSPTKNVADRSAFFEDWKRHGYDYVVNRYLIPKRKWIFDFYYAMPHYLRALIRKLMDKRMRYE